jgi:DNA-binding Lrp family transcriptional regulator
VSYELDDVDRKLLNLLQENARYTALTLAEEVGVSDNTVHNRMERLEEAGVITGYTTSIDLDRTGLTLYFQFACTANINGRRAVAEQAMEIPAVLEVTELMTGQRNLQIKVVAARDEDITRIAERLDQLDLEINDENLIRAVHTGPLDFVELTDRIDLEE